MSSRRAEGVGAAEVRSATVRTARGRTAAGRRPRRVAVLAGTALVTVFAATACKIPATGVVDAGEPATGIKGSTQLYFLSFGGLTGVRWETTVPAGPDEALHLLAAGPGGPDIGTGLATEVSSTYFQAGPAVPQEPSAADVPPGFPGGGPVTMAPPSGSEPEDAASAAPQRDRKRRTWATASGNRVVVKVRMGPEKLPRLGVQQIVCTVAHARMVEAPGVGPVDVVFDSPDGESDPERCDWESIAAG